MITYIAIDCNQFAVKFRCLLSKFNCFIEILLSGKAIFINNCQLEQGQSLRRCILKILYCVLKIRKSLLEFSGNTQ